MDDWLGVIAIVVVCGGVFTLLVVVLRLMARAEAGTETEQRQGMEANRTMSEESPPYGSGSNT